MSNKTKGKGIFDYIVYAIEFFWEMILILVGGVALIWFTYAFFQMIFQ